MTWWQLVIGAGLTLVGTYITAKFALKSSTHATDKSAEVQQEQNAVTGYEKLTADLRKDLDRVRVDLTRLTESHETLTGKHETLTKKHENLREHVTTLEQQRARDKTLIRYLINYARQLRDELVKVGVPVPDGPGGIDLDDPIHDRP